MSDHQGILRIAVRKFDPFESAMKKLWTKYCLDSGCTLKAEFVAMDLPLLHQVTLADGGLIKGDWDIAHINTDWLDEGVSSAAFEDLSPYIKQHPPADFPHGWSTSLLGLQQFEDKIFGLPFHDGPECLIYRKDLFEDPAEQEKYLLQYGKPLRPPENWEDFTTIAHFFHRPEKNLYGSVFACYPDGHNVVFDFFLQLWSRGGTLLNEKEEIIIHTPAAIAALDFYRKIIKDEKAVHPGSVDYDSVQAGMAFARGEAALMINWFGFAAMCEIAEESITKGKVEITLLPASEGHKSASLNVYWLYTIGTGSRHKQTAYDFIQFAINQENDKLLTMEGGIGCRISTWQDQEVNQVIPYYHKLEQLHECARSLPQKKNWAKIASIIDQAVLNALNSTVPSTVLLSTAQEQINKQ